MCISSFSLEPVQTQSNLSAAIIAHTSTLAPTVAHLYQYDGRNRQLLKQSLPSSNGQINHHNATSGTSFLYLSMR
jgi:hypothetical protein